MHRHFHRWVIALWLVVVASAEPGCSHSGGSASDLGGMETGHDHEGEVLSEACEHMAEGPSQEVRASPTGDPGAPSVASPHTRFDATLVAVDGGQGGDLSYAVSRAGLLWVALSKDVPLQITREVDGQSLTPEEVVAGPDTGCDEVAWAAAYPVEVGTVRIRLGPTTQTQVSLVLELEAE